MISKLIFGLTYFTIIWWLIVHFRNAGFEIINVKGYLKCNYQVLCLSPNYGPNLIQPYRPNI